MKKINSITLRNILIGALLLSLVITGGVFYFAYCHINQYAQTVSNLNTKANDSDDSLENLQKLSNLLDKQKNVLKKSENIVASSQDYNYQNEIISDLSNYAVKTGVSLSQINFTSDTSLTTGNTSLAITNAPIVAGLKTVTISLTLSSPLPYVNLLHFIKALENNLTAMQISEISISHDSTMNSSYVSIQPLTINMYTR